MTKILHYYYRHSYGLRLKIEKMNLRERYLMLLVLFVVVLVGVHFSLVLLGFDKHGELLDRIEARKNEANQVSAQLKEYQNAIGNNKLNALKSSNDNLNQRIEDLSLKLSKLDEKMISPEKMIELLTSILNNQKGIVVDEITVLPVEAVKTNSNDNQLNDSETGYYQHGIFLKLESSYEDLMRYLLVIENSIELPLFWDDLLIQTSDFPKLKVEMKIHTLSQKKDWLDV